MSNIVKQTSIKLANSLGKELNVDSNKIDIFRYGLELILGGLLKFFIIAIISYVIGSFKTTMFCIMSYIPIRHFGGGVHLSTYYRCLTTGTIIFVLLGKITIFNTNPSFLSLIIIFVFFLGIYIIYKWVPARIGDRVIECEKQKKKQKFQTIFVLTLLFCLNIFFMKFNLADYALVSISGVLLSLIFITPLGYKLINALDYIINKIQGDNTNV